MYQFIVRDKVSQKVVAEAECDITKKGTKVSVTIPFPRPNPIEMLYKATIGPIIIVATWVLIKARNRPC